MSQLFVKLFAWLWFALSAVAAGLVLTHHYWVPGVVLPTVAELEEHAAELQALTREGRLREQRAYLRALQRQESPRMLLVPVGGDRGEEQRGARHGYLIQALAHDLERVLAQQGAQQGTSAEEQSALTQEPEQGVERGGGRGRGREGAEPRDTEKERPQEAAWPAIRGSIGGRGTGTIYHYRAVPLWPTADALQQTPHYLVAAHPRRALLELPLPLVALVSLSITAALAAMLARRFSQRVRRLRAVSQRLAGGLLEARTGAPPSGGDEITALGRDFDRMAERLQILIESRIRLLRDLSHELRSPLARLQTALELARARPTTAASYLDRIEREIERLDGLIGQALSLARLEAGIEPFHYTTIDLAALLAEICADARFEHATRSDRGAITAQGAITSQGTTTPEDENGSGDLSPLPREEAPEGASVYLQEGPAARLQGDRRLLRSALENIVRNAVYHTPPSGAVEVSWRWETAERLNISVTDAGPGVAEADLPRLFEPFQRLEGSPGHEYAGHGLGLAIAKRAIEAHGGSVRAENRSGGGLHLAVELPTNA